MKIINEYMELTMRLITRYYIGSIIIVFVLRFNFVATGNCSYILNERNCYSYRLNLCTSKRCTLQLLKQFKFFNCCEYFTVFSAYLFSFVQRKIISLSFMQETKNEIRT